MSLNLDGRVFRPVNNSEAGRVDGSALFEFAQTGLNFTATYSGSGVLDGHLIGVFRSESTASLIYHSRSKCGKLEAGEAVAEIQRGEYGRHTLSMNWTWLNGSRTSGSSDYIEILTDKTPEDST